LRLLVVSSCTGEKKYSPPNQLALSDFDNPSILKGREEELFEYSCMASDMYTGQQHLYMMEGLQALRKNLPDNQIDLYILSAGYGLIPEDKIIAPYNVTFAEMTSSQIKQLSKSLDIRTELVNILPKYDMVFFLLGDDYLRALDLNPPLEVALWQRYLFFASKKSSRQIPVHPRYCVLPLGPEDATRFHCALVSLKGLLFKLIAQKIISNDTDGISLQDIWENPEVIPSFFYNVDKQIIQTSLDGFSSFPAMSGMSKPSTWWCLPKGRAANWHIPMRFFLPEGDDRVDPEYDFLTDTHLANRDGMVDDRYSHEFYQKPNYNGLLVSRTTIESNKRKKALLSEEGIHSFFRLSKDIPVMGDCGAFMYLTDPEPRYTTKDILEYYQLLGFDYGVSIDHLIVGEYARNVDERKRRYDITRKNAVDFLKLWKEGDALGRYNFKPIGVAQGWDRKSYRDAVAELIEVGYDFIALGGLAKADTRQITEILQAVGPLIPEYAQMHLFGVSRLDWIPLFREWGVTSVDSASPLRQAWMGAENNYHTMDGPSYAAIRVPPLKETSKTVRNLCDVRGITFEDLQKYEQRALRALREYGQNMLDLEDTVAAVMSYEKVVRNDKNDVMEPMYRETLADRPWENCGCPICRSIGIEVIIFRSNNRNRRRGFHNTHVFFKKFKQIIGNFKN